MAWTAPMTFTAASVLTATQLNTHLRDNLLETAPAKASIIGSYFAVVGANSIAERRIVRGVNLDYYEETSTTVVDGSSPLAVTVETGTKVVAMWSAWINNDTANNWSQMTLRISGATTTASSDDWAMEVDGQPAGNPYRVSNIHPFTVNAGSNTFTTQYRTQGGTAGYLRRELVIFPL